MERQYRWWQFWAANRELAGWKKKYWDKVRDEARALDKAKTLLNQRDSLALQVLSLKEEVVRLSNLLTPKRPSPVSRDKKLKGWASRV